MAAIEALPAGLPERPATPVGRPRVLLLTEGTYPYAMGGVSSWCELLVNGLSEFDWQVLPIVAPHGKPPLYELPPHAREVGRIEVWSEAIPRGGRRGSAWGELPGILVRGLLGWEGDTDAVLAAWIRCRRNPAGVRRAFRSRAGWAAFLAGLNDVLRRCTGSPARPRIRRRRRTFCTSPRRGGPRSRRWCTARCTGRPWC
jgi:hypothetical protein